MALGVGTNSYLNAIAADAYFADRLNSSVWVASTTKDQALIQATKMIDNLKFKGYKAVPTQALMFPRIPSEQLYGYQMTHYDEYGMYSVTTPQRVLDATCELAIWLLQDDYTAPNDLEQFDNVKLGGLEVKTSTSTEKKLPPMVIELLKPFRDSSMRLVRA